MMIRLYLPFFLALLFLVGPKESIGQDGQLTQINSVTIVVWLSDKAKEMGLTKRGIKDQILVSLRSKLPRLAVNKLAHYRLLVSVSLVYERIPSGEKTNTYFGHILVAVLGYVTQLETNKPVLAPLWTLASSLMGPAPDSSETANNIVDQMLTKFAADWYRDNPSK